MLMMFWFYLKGATGVGVIKKVVQPGIFGKDGRIDIDFTNIYGVDGTLIPITVGELAKQKAESIASLCRCCYRGYDYPLVLLV